MSSYSILETSYLPALILVASTVIIFKCHKSKLVLWFLGFLSSVVNSEVQQEKFNELRRCEGRIQQNAGQHLTGGQLTYNRAEEGCFPGACVAGQSDEALSAENRVL